MILGAVYMLVMYRNVIFGKIVNPVINSIRDLNAREMTILVPLAVIILWMGIYPNSFLSVFNPVVTAFTNSDRIAELMNHGHIVADNINNMHSIFVR